MYYDMLGSFGDQGKHPDFIKVSRIKEVTLEEFTLKKKSLRMFPTEVFPVFVEVAR